MPSLDGIAFAAEFRTSMPLSYRQSHSLQAIREHAAIVARRGDAPAHVELWRAEVGTVIVVVTDDRPDCLGFMSAAIAAVGFDIVIAEAYCRARDGRPAEAVALFEVRRPHDPERPIAPDDVAPLTQVLESLIQGQRDAHLLLKRNAQTAPPGRQAFPEVTFADDEVSILLVQSRDRPGLLATIASTLTAASVRILKSEVVTVAGRVRDRFHLSEANGAPLSGLRREDISRRVLAVLEQSDHENSSQ